MAASLKVSTDSAALRRKLEDRLVKRAPRAAVAGINRVARGAYTLSVREIQADVGASSQKTIRRNLTVHPARGDKPEAQVQAFSAKKDRIPIYEMKPRPKSVTKRRPAGGVRWGANQRLIPGSFIARVRSGHMGVFKRQGKSRLPIAELFGPSVALVFSRKKILAKVTGYIREKLPIEIARAFKFVTG